MTDDLHTQLSFLGPELPSLLLGASKVAQVPKGIEILKTHQYIKVLPLVLSGLVKVSSRFEDREMLLYYIQPGESCVMSMAAGLNQRPSRVFAVTEKDSDILMLPMEKVPQWLHDHHRLNDLFYRQYDLRYAELLDTIHHVLLDKMDHRLYQYLVEKVQMTQQPLLKLSHGQIANELGTVREVISRVIKKLEHEGKVHQHLGGIEIL